MGVENIQGDDFQNDYGSNTWDGAKRKKLLANTTSKRSNRNPYKDLSFSKSSFLRKFVMYLVSFCSFLSIFSGLQICQISQSPSPQHQLSGFACDHCVSYWSKGTLILTTAPNMYKWLLVLKVCICFHFPTLIHKNSAFSFACIFMTQWRRQDDEDLGWLWFPVTFFFRVTSWIKKSGQHEDQKTNNETNTFCFRDPAIFLKNKTMLKINNLSSRPKNTLRNTLRIEK